jgi:outer membrane protein TolC
VRTLSAPLCSATAQSLDLARVRLETGLATTVDVQVAQSSVATADDTLIRTRFAAALAGTRLAWATGDVRQAFAGPPPSPSN